MTVWASPDLVGIEKSTETKLTVYHYQGTFLPLAHLFSKVGKIQKYRLDLISSPSPSVKIRKIVGKVYFKVIRQNIAG